MAFFGMKLGSVDIAVLDCSNKFPMIVGRCDGERAVICCQGKAVQEVDSWEFNSLNSSFCEVD